MKKDKHFIRPSPHQNTQRHSRLYWKPGQHGRLLFFSGGPCGVETKVWDDGSAGWEPLIMLIGDQKTLPENLTHNH